MHCPQHCLEDRLQQRTNNFKLQLSCEECSLVTSPPVNSLRSRIHNFLAFSLSWDGSFKLILDSVTPMSSACSAPSLYRTAGICFHRHKQCLVCVKSGQWSSKSRLVVMVELVQHGTNLQDKKEEYGKTLSISATLEEHFTPLITMAEPENNRDLLDQCQRKISEGNIKNVRFELSDLNGIARSKTIPARHFQSLAKSGILMPACLYTMDSVDDVIKNEYFKKYIFSDLMCSVDLSTFTVLPWAKNTSRVFVSPLTDCNCAQVSVDPRNLALKQLSHLKERNLSILSSFEYEFWVFHAATKEPITDDHNSLATIRLAKHQDFFDRISENLYSAGVDVECVYSEHAFGHFEMPISPAFGIKSADNAATLRVGVKEMALQDNYVASFMTKPFDKQDGAGAHLNHSLWSVDGKDPKLSDPSRPFGLSEIGEHWIAGLLAHAPALSLLQGPTLNCRDRLEPGVFAPINATWGVDNRSCAIRWKERGRHGSHVEDRIGSSAGSPYISLAAMIAAGIDGIDRQLPLPKGVSFNKYAQDEEDIPPGTELLPTNQEDALNALLSDQAMVSALGPDFIAFFKGLKQHEMQVFQESMQGIGKSKLEWEKKYYSKYL